jgi:uncharacterized protein
MLIKVLAERMEDGEQKTFYFDNATFRVSEQPFDVDPVHEIDYNTVQAKGAKRFAMLKIQLGLKCNYSCSYCGQRENERGEDATPDDVPGFLALLDNIELTPRPTIEFWGGEPLVYIKTLRPLAEAMRARYPDAHIKFITNGSLLTKELVDWCIALDIGVGISHDGPNQHQRGDDPLIDNKEAIDYAIEKLIPRQRLGFSSVLTKENPSRTAVIEFFKRKYPDVMLPIGEMVFADVFNEHSDNMTAFSLQEHIAIRRSCYQEFRFNSDVGERCTNLTHNIQTNMGREFMESPLVRQKCGMDQPHTLAIDIKGNVLSCHNVTAAGVSQNGKSHKIGHISDLASVRLATATHWTKREECPSCPVLSSCQGGCMTMAGDFWKKTCDMSFTTFVVLFAMSFEAKTGYVPIFFDCPDLPYDRQDVWGCDTSKLEDKPVRRVIPIRAV